MKLLCRQMHVFVSASGYKQPARPYLCQSLNDYLCHHLFVHGSEKRRSWLTAKGFIDTKDKTDRGLAVWRWDFWNSWLADEIRSIKAEAQREREQNAA